MVCDDFPILAHFGCGRCCGIGVVMFGVSQSTACSIKLVGALLGKP
jgi:hypothetical protein